MKVLDYFISYQGEGQDIGAPALFLRLDNCNLDCPFCDEKNNFSKGKEYSVDEMLSIICYELSRLPDIKECLIIITGGEPLLQSTELKELTKKLYKYDSNIRIHVETNATLRRDIGATKYTISPKEEYLTYNHIHQIVSYYNKLGRQIELKIVITLENMKDIIKLINQLNLDITLYLQPEFSQAEQVVNLLIERWHEIRVPFKISVQTHKYINQK